MLCEDFSQKLGWILSITAILKNKFINASFSVMVVLKNGSSLQQSSESVAKVLKNEVQFWWSCILRPAWSATLLKLPKTNSFRCILQGFRPQVSEEVLVLLLRIEVTMVSVPELFSWGVFYPLFWKKPFDVINFVTIHCVYTCFQYNIV